MPKHIKQYKINYICSALQFCKIRSTHDLLLNMDNVLAYIKQNPDIFKPHYNRIQCADLLKAAIKAYNNAHDYSIRCSDDLLKYFNYSRLYSPITPTEYTIPTDDDLNRVTRNYDRLSYSPVHKCNINELLLDLLENNKDIFIPEIIIGEGDTGTTLWLEKFSSEHNKTLEIISSGKLPNVLIIAFNTGSWKHDYTLAQPQNILERAVAKSNPSDFMSRNYYWTNPYANGRHVYQSNQLNLSKTDAPRLTGTVECIEKRDNHIDDWKEDECSYRITIITGRGAFLIYTHNINVCTGLGPARVDLKGTGLSDNEFRQLNTYDAKRKFTPIVDGNQFILTNTEENNCGRTIVIYGGGGTAAAVYRKAYHGHDIRTEPLGFDNLNRKNKVLWVAKNFDKAGTGKLASSALYNSDNRNERFEGELTKIEVHNNDRLRLSFLVYNSKDKTIEIECDQFVFSIGQEDLAMKAVCREIDSELNLVEDKYGMPLALTSIDKQITFFGAAAMAMRVNEYMSATWKWLQSENIQGDVGPGSMPPSRAQIKRYLSLKGVEVKCINVNMDSKELMVYFLSNLGIEDQTAHLFVEEVLDTRLTSTSGGTRSMLSNLIQKYKLSNVVVIYGHGHLIPKSYALPLLNPVHPLPKHSIFGHSMKSAPDSNIFLSSNVAQLNTDNNENLQKTGDSVFTVDTK